MDITTILYILIAVLSVGISIATAIALHFHKHLLAFERELEEALSGKKSAEVLKGHLFEKLFPWAKSFPYRAENLSPIFHPIDFIHWGEDKITFLELKSGQSQLSSKQKAIKKLVEEKKVEWKEFRDKDIKEN